MKQENNNMKFAFLSGVISLLLCGTYFFYTRVEKVVDQDSIIVGTNAEFAPFSFYKDGMITGFDIDVVHEIGKRLSKKIIIKDLPFDTLIPEIQLNKLHMVVGGINPTPERAQQVLFTDPVFEADVLVMLTLQDVAVENIDQLAHKKVIVNEGYYADSFVSALTLPMEIIRLGTNNTIEALGALALGKGDVFIASWQTVIPFLTDAQKKMYRVVLIEGSNEKDAFVIAKKYPVLLEQCNEIIPAMKKDGTLKALQDKWFGTVKALI